MIEYFRPLKHDNFTLSIDNVVSNYHIGAPFRDRFMKFLNKVSFRYCCDLKYWENMKPGAYKMNFTFTFADGNSFWIGMGQGYVKTNYGTVRMEYNPNKVARHDCFRTVLAYLNGNTNPMHQNISRYDLAVDYPCLRENAFMTKDKRSHMQFDNSPSDKTEWLGKRSKVGAVKLYNKQLESKLSFPLTRLEITLDPLMKLAELPIPTVRFLNDMQICFDEAIGIDDTDRCLLTGVLAGAFAVTDLSRRKRKTIESLLDLYTTKFELSMKQYELIKLQLKSFFEYPAKPLDAHETDLDILKDYVCLPKDIDWSEYEDIGEDEIPEEFKED